MVALSTVFGTIGAIGIFYCKKRTSSILTGINQIPVINADVVTAISLALLIAILGIDRNTYIPLVLGQMVLCTPFVILSVIPKLEQMDPNLYEAALDLGASPRKALFSVVIPQILPGIISGFLLAVTLSLDDFVIADYTKPDTFQTISTHIYYLSKHHRHKTKASYWAFTAIIFLIIVIVLVTTNIISYKNHGAKNNEKNYFHSSFSFSSLGFRIIYGACDTRPVLKVASWVDYIDMGGDDSYVKGSKSLDKEFEDWYYEQTGKNPGGLYSHAGQRKHVHQT
ncbi:MAG: ABC transporter permease [Christensenellaceae bacterium]